MSLLKTTDIATFNTYIENSPYGHFMQTSSWSDLKKNFGWKHLGYYFIQEANTTIGAFSVLLKQKFGIKILYIPRGPVCDYSNVEQLHQCLTAIKQLAKQEKAFFIRISPKLLEPTPIIAILQKENYILSNKQLQTKQTSRIDLNKETEMLLASFHEKTRYNIRLAGKKGVTVSPLTTPSELDVFYTILQKMALRQDYVLQAKAYYQYIWEKLVPAGKAQIYLARTADTIIGGVVVFFSSDTAYYMYGGFAYEYRNLMGNYLVHWQIMQEAKVQGLTWYDLQGIPKIKDENHPAYGFYRFKKGFNGEEVEFIGEYDFSPIPALYKFWNALAFEKNLYLQ